MTTITVEPVTDEPWCCQCELTAVGQVAGSPYCTGHLAVALLAKQGAAVKSGASAPAIIVVGSRPAAAGPRVWVRGDRTTTWIPYDGLDYEAQVVTDDPDWRDYRELEVERPDGSRETVPGWAIYQEP